MDGENRRSREAVRNSVRTYGVKVMDPASLPLKKTSEKESQDSVSRFSEKSLHSQYKMQEGVCKSILNRIPYATLLACILCVLGVVLYAAASRRALVLTKTMVNDVLQQESSRLASFDVVFSVAVIATAITAVLILIIGVLATGDTRAKVYHGWKARIGGRLCCAVLMVLTLFLMFVWFLIFWLFASLYFLLALSQTECDLATELQKDSLDLNGLNIFVDGKARHIVINGLANIKRFCKDYVEKVVPAYVIIGFANGVVLFSLVLFLICLAANYARIRCQAKFQEVEELRRLEGDLHSSRDRF